MKKRLSKKAITILMCLIFVFTLIGCGGSSGSSSNYDSSVGTFGDTKAQSSSSVDGFASNSFSGSSDEASEETSDDTSTPEEVESSLNENMQKDGAENKTDGNTVMLEDKLVYRCSIRIETMEYTDTMQSIKNSIEKFNGIIQSETETNSDNDWYENNNMGDSGIFHSELQVRVPSKNYNDFINSVGDSGKVMSKDSSVDNISREYHDKSARVEALEIEKSRLVDMMNEANSIDEMITVEDRLSEVESEIDSLNTQLITMDQDVAYSYVAISVDEVLKYEMEGKKGTTFFNRLWNTILSAVSDWAHLLEQLIFALIYLIPLIAIITILSVVIWKHSGKKLKNKVEQAKQSNNEYNNQVSQYKANYTNGQKAVQEEQIEQTEQKEQVEQTEQKKTDTKK